VILPDTYALVSITESSSDTIELRCIARAEDSDGLHWTMARDDVQDLARWWSTEDILVKSGQRPLRDKECGNVLVSMFTPSMIHVRVRDTFGNIRVVGYSFPRAVLEHVDHWAVEQRLDSHALSRPGDT
jgi:hypothetical protein